LALSRTTLSPVISIFSASWWRLMDSVRHVIGGVEVKEQRFRMRLMTRSTTHQSIPAGRQRRWTARTR
jgi:hypothetical protein